MTPLAQVALRTEDDLFVARQLGRECAAGLGLDRLDALRVATAISELGREIVSCGGGSVALAVTGSVLQVRWEGVRPSEQWSVAISAVSRLVDRQRTYDAGAATCLVLEKIVPSPPPEAAVLERLRKQLLTQNPTTPDDELRAQNSELLSALEEVRAQRAELEVVNRELEETNRGVMALYAELSAELDRTNQGVVALYAEIDDKNLQLRRASEAKTRFLRSISHELRTPVNSILGLTGLLLDPHQTDRLTEEHTEQVQYIRTSAGDLQRLVEELLDLAKAESGRLEPTLAETSLADLLKELRGVIDPILRPGVELHVDLVDVDVIETDPDLLRHVLRNLLSNAAKFTPSGSIRLTARTDQTAPQDAAPAVLVEVRDTGLGIGEEDLTRIFEEFYQATSPLHATAKGTGLGLPFAQVVATALGGRIEVESVVGEGSCFSLWLPTGRRP